MLAVAVEALVQEANAFLQVVPILLEHAVADPSHPADAALQLVAPPAAQPRGADDQLLRVHLEVSEDANVVIDAEQRPLLSPPIDLLWHR